MPASKALFFVVLLGGVVLAIVFTFMPDYRPGVVQEWIDKAGGFTPAETPQDALEKFRECIRKRNYVTAKKYLMGDYRKEFMEASKAATQLADSVDDLSYTANDTIHLNAPDANYVLDALQPFPKEFDFTVEHPVKDKQYRILSQLFPTEFPSDQMKVIGDKVALAVITFKLAKEGEPKSGRMNMGGFEPKAFLALVPLGIKWDGYVALKQEDEGKEKGWKILFPLTNDIPPKVDYLKHNYGNYVQALKNVKYAIKHDAASKNEFESELSKYLVESK